MDNVHPWDRMPQWTDEEWAEEVKRRRIATEEVINLLNREAREAQERRERWKERTKDMTPRQIGTMLLEMRAEGRTIAEVSELVGASTSTIIKYCKLGVYNG